MEHAGVHREGQPQTLGRKGLIQRAEVAEGTIGPFDEQAQVIGRGHFAEREGVSSNHLVPAGGGGGRVGRQRQANKPAERGKPAAAHPSALSRLRLRPRPRGRRCRAARRGRRRGGASRPAVEGFVGTEAQVGGVFQREFRADAAAQFALVAGKRLDRVLDRDGARSGMT